MSRFNVLTAGDDSDSDDLLKSSEKVSEIFHKTIGRTHESVGVGVCVSVGISGASSPSYEDLSLIRTDEETVLSAVYGPDFKRENGVWGCSRLSVRVRPPDTDREEVGCEAT